MLQFLAKLNYLSFTLKYSLYWPQVLACPFQLIKFENNQFT